MYELRMPSLGADMEAGTLIEWLVKPGDAVKRGDIVASVDTDKAVIDMEIWQTGVIEELIVQPGERVPVGTVLALVRTAGEPEAEPTAQQPLPAAPPPRAAPAHPVPPPTVSPTAPVTTAVPGRGHVTPWARKLAQELGVELATVRGTGIDGAITHSDVERAAARPTPSAGDTAGLRRASPRARKLAQELGVALDRVTGSGPEGAVLAGDVQQAAEGAKAPAAAAQAPPTPAERAASMRRAIAAAMARSKREIPHYYLATRIDMATALDWLQARNAQRPVPERLLYSVLLIKAVAKAVDKVPEMNGYWQDDRFQPGEGVHVGMAVSLRQGGLIAPAIMDVQDKGLDQLMTELRDLVARARAGRLRGAEMTRATITITNLGEQGVDSVYGIIYPPQVALVGFGRISPQRTVSATLAGDHRASDGHRGAVYLNTIDRLLQQPASL